MRFIIDLVLYALIFYAIYVYYPLVFQILVAGVAKLFDALQSIVDNLIEKMHQPIPAPKAQLPFLVIAFQQFLRR